MRRSAWNANVTGGSPLETTTGGPETDLYFCPYSETRGNYFSCASFDAVTPWRRTIASRRAQAFDFLEQVRASPAMWAELPQRPKLASVPKPWYRSKVCGLHGKQLG